MIGLLLLLASPPTPTAEVARLQAWFAQADAILETNTPQDLGPAARARRAAIRAELRAYAAGGLFPANPEPGWSPVFVDVADTRCAVAHLLEVTGEEALMRRVAATANRASILDIQGDPDLRAWLEWHGLTAADAAAIQPTYEGTAYDCICSWEFASADDLGVLEVEPTEAGFVVRAVLGGDPPWGVGDVVEATAWQHPSGAGPWVLVALRWGAEWEARLIDGARCPDLAPYPGTGARLTPELVAEAVLAREGCPDVLVAADGRWGHSTSCTGCAAGGGPTVAWAAFLIALSWGRRRRRTRAPRR